MKKQVGDFNGNFSEARPVYNIYPARQMNENIEEEGGKS